MTDNVYIGVVLDRSGSMASVRDDAIGGFNTFLQEQQEQHSGKLRLTLFNTDVETVYAGDLQRAEPLTEKTYVPNGFTAMYDAIGRCVHEIGTELAALPENERPAKVVIAIYTDGLENASREHSKAAIKTVIEHQEQEYNWTFTNMDASAEASSIGIRAMNAMTFTSDSRGTLKAYSQMSRAVTKSLSGDSQ